MELLNEWIKYFDKFNIEEKINITLKRIEGKIALYNKEQLYNKGVTSDNSAVTPLYTPLTIKIKKSKGQRTDHVTLKDTGAFHNSMFVVYAPRSFQIYARNNKTNKLVKKYGDNIFGMTDININKMNWEDVYPALMQEIRKDIK